MLKKILFSLILIMLAVGMVGSTLSYLTDVESSVGNTFTAAEVFPHPTSGPILYYLYNPNSSNGMMTIPAGMTVSFATEQSAQNDVTFPEGDWTVVIKTDSEWSDHCVIIVREYAPPGGIIANNNGPAYLMTFSIHSPSFTVHNGNYLGVTISNYDNIAHTCYLDSGSYLTVPPVSPVYPTPEMPAGMLLGLGLAGLGGFIFLRRIQAVKEIIYLRFRF